MVTSQKKKGFKNWHPVTFLVVNMGLKLNNMIRLKNVIFSTLSCCICYSCGPSTTTKKAPYYPPPGSWERKLPEDEGVNPEKLSSAITFALANEVRHPGT